MGSAYVDIADAVVAVINAHVGYSQVLTASRKHMHQIERLNHVLECYVVPKSEEITIAARHMIQRTVGIDVVIMGPAATEAIREGLADLVEEVSTSLRGVTMDGANWIGETREPIYSIENISGLDQFTAVLTETYVAMTSY